MKTANKWIKFFQPCIRSLVNICTGFFVLLLFVADLAPARAEVILVTDAEYGAQNLGALFAVEGSGIRSLLSDFNDASQGPTGFTPVGVAVTPAGVPVGMGNAGDIWVVDNVAGPSFHGALFRVDSAGMRTLVSDFGNASQGPTGLRPYAVAVEKSGMILVVDYDTGTGYRKGVLFRVDPATGNRTVLTDFGDPAQGPTGAAPMGVAIEASNSILVCATRVLFRVDPTTGQRTLLSDLADSGQGPVGFTPRDVAVEPFGTLLVADSQGGTDNRGTIFGVDPTYGTRIRLSDFGDPAQGPIGAPIGMTLMTTGEILVISSPGGSATGDLLFVDSTNGNRTLISDFTNPSQGPLGVLPYRVAAGTLLPPPGAPAAPSNLQAAVDLGSRGSNVFLQWDNNSINVDYFEVWRSEDGGVTFGLTALGTTTYSFFIDQSARIRPPPYPARYCYKVLARNSDGSSDFSNTDCPLLPPAAREALDAYGFPGPPTARIVLGWINPIFGGDPPTRIRILRSDGPRGPILFYDEIPVNDTANQFYDDTNVITNKEYCYQVVATNGRTIASLSQLSNVACARAPLPLSILTSQFRVTPTSVTFNWTTNAAATGGVSLNGGALVSSRRTGTSHSVTIHHLSAGATYSFSVEATRTVFPGESVYKSGGFTTPLGLLSISNVRVSTSPTSATIRWRTNSRADGRVEYGIENAGVCSYPSTLPSGTNLFSHSTTINDLVPGNPYCYRLVATTVNDIAEYTDTFETIGVPQIDVRAGAGWSLIGPDQDGNFSMEIPVAIMNRRGRTILAASNVGVSLTRTTLEVPCDQRDYPPRCMAASETVDIQEASLPSNPLNLAAGESATSVLRFPVRVPMRSVTRASRAVLRLGIDYQYDYGAGTESTTSDFTIDVNLQRFGLSIRVSDSADPVPLNTDLIYTVKIANDGICDAAIAPCDATGVSVTLDWIAPAGTSFISANIGFRDCEETGASSARCNLPAIQTGTVVSVRAIFRTPTSLAPGERNNPIKLHAKVISSVSPDPYPDPYRFDDEVVEFTTIEPTLALVDVSAELDGRTTSTSSDGYTSTATVNFCNIGARRLSNLKSVTAALPREAVLVNRDRGSPRGVGSRRTFPFNGGYTDGVLDHGECVEVTYYVNNLSDTSGLTELRLGPILGLILP